MLGLFGVVRRGSQGLEGLGSVPPSSMIARKVAEGVALVLADAT